jgi:hypothetical protein
MTRNPGDEVVARTLARRDAEDDSLGFVHRGLQLVPIHQQEGFQRRVPSSLVAVCEGMVLN